MVFGKINDYTGEKLSGANVSLFDPIILSTIETIPVDDRGEYLFTIEKGKKIGFLVEKKGYTLTVGGRYCAVMKGSDKGKAVQTLLQHYRKDFANAFRVNHYKRR